MKFNSINPYVKKYVTVSNEKPPSISVERDPLFLNKAFTVTYYQEIVAEN